MKDLRVLYRPFFAVSSIALMVFLFQQIGKFEKYPAQWLRANQFLDDRLDYLSAPTELFSQEKKDLMANTFSNNGLWLKIEVPKNMNYDYLMLSSRLKKVALYTSQDGISYKKNGVTSIYAIGLAAKIERNDGIAAYLIKVKSQVGYPLTVKFYTEKQFASANAAMTLTTYLLFGIYIACFVFLVVFLCLNPSKTTFLYAGFFAFYHIIIQFINQIPFFRSLFDANQISFITLYAAQINFIFFLLFIFSIHKKLHFIGIKVAIYLTMLAYFMLDISVYFGLLQGIYINIVINLICKVWFIFLIAGLLFKLVKRQKIQLVALSIGQVFLFSGQTYYSLVNFHFILGDYTNIMLATNIADAFFFLVSSLVDQKQKMHLATLEKMEASAKYSRAEESVAMMAHDIRKPFRQVGLLFQLLSDTRYSASSATLVKKNSEQIQRSICLMNEILDDLLMCNKKKQSPEQCSARKIIYCSLVEVFSDATYKGIDFSYDIKEEYFFANFLNIERCFINIVRNAATMMKSGGGIHFTVQKSGEFVAIKITNTNSFIKKSEINYIFEPFYGTSQNGSGLGLAIVKKYVEQEGGRVSCQSDGESYVTFSINLPAYTGSVDQDFLENLPKSSDDFQIGWGYEP